MQRKWLEEEKEGGKKAFLIGDANVTFLPLQPAVGGRAAEDD